MQNYVLNGTAFKCERVCYRIAVYIAAAGIILLYKIKLSTLKEGSGGSDPPEPSFSVNFFLKLYAIYNENIFSLFRIITVVFFDNWL
jgi:hypothetical protein